MSLRALTNLSKSRKVVEVVLLVYLFGFVPVVALAPTMFVAAGATVFAVVCMISFHIGGNKMAKVLQSYSNNNNHGTRTAAAAEKVIGARE